VLLRALILALCCSLISCKNLVEKYKRSSSGVSELEKKVLYDFRATPQSAAPAVGADEARLIFAALPPASCPVSAKEPKKTPDIVGVAKGSFTYAAEQETAYLVGDLPCGTHQAIVVISGGKAQATSETAYAAILGTFDLDKDDKNEMLLGGGTNHDGVISREASLDVFEKNSLRAVENFGIVYSDACHLFSGADEVKKKTLIASGLSPYIEAVRVLYLPRPNHEMPSFTAERYRAACPDTPGGQLGPWQLVSGK